MNGLSPGIELDPKPSCQDVFNRGRKFLSYAVDDLGLKRRPTRKNRLGETAVLQTHLQHFPCGRSKFACQVVGRFFGDWVDSHKLFPEIAAELFSSVKDMRSGRRFLDWSTERLLDSVDGVLSHGALSGPLSTHDADQPAG